MFMAQKIRESGTKIVYLMSPVDPNTSAGMFQEGVLYLINSYERRNIRAKSIQGQRSRFRKGYRAFGSMPNGYVRELNGKEKIVVPDRIKSKIIKNALEMYAAGVLETPHTVYKYFKSQGITPNSPTNKTGKLHPTIVINTFKPETIYFYAGYFYKPMRDVNEPFRAQHPPIISMETAQKILARIEESSILGTRHPLHNPDFPIKDFTYCGHCEKKMTGYWSKGRHAKYPYYGCANKKDPKRFQVPRKKLTDKFQEFLAGITIPKEVWQVFAVILQAYWEQKDQIKEEWKKNQQREVKQLENQMQKIEQVLVQSSNLHLITKMEAEWSNLNDQKLAIEREIKQREVGSAKSLIGLLTSAEKIFTSLKNVRHLSNHEIKRMCLRVFFGGRIFYTPEQGFRTA